MALKWKILCTFWSPPPLLSSVCLVRTFRKRKGAVYSVTPPVMRHLRVCCLPLPLPFSSSLCCLCLKQRIFRPMELFGSKLENVRPSNFQGFHQWWLFSETLLVTNKLQQLQIAVCSSFKERKKAVVKVSYSLWSVEYLTFQFTPILTVLVEMCDCVSINETPVSVSW